jgi:hypothetical protein
MPYYITMQCFITKRQAKLMLSFDLKRELTKVALYHHCYFLWLLMTPWPNGPDVFIPWILLRWSWLIRTTYQSLDICVNFRIISHKPNSCSSRKVFSYSVVRPLTGSHPLLLFLFRASETSLAVRFLLSYVLTFGLFLPSLSPPHHRNSCWRLTRPGPLRLPPIALYF